MRVKEGFVMRKVAGQTIVVATGEAAETFQGMVKLNETGKVIWTALSEGLDEDAVAQRLVESYEVDEAQAKADVAAFVAQMQEAGFLA